MLRLLLVFLGAAILFYLALIFESTGFALLSFTAVTLAVLFFLVLWCLRKRVTVSLSIPLKVVDRGQEFGLNVEVQNKMPFPLGRLRVDVWHGESSALAKNARKIMVEDVIRGKSTTTKRISIQTAGYFEFSIKRIRIYDPFGCLYVTRKCKSIAKVMIFPKIEEIPIRLGEGVKHFYGETMDYDEQEPGHDPSEVFGFREFRDGDKLQRIHWKLSARMDDLIIKEDSLPKACAIVLFMPAGVMSECKSLDFVASFSFTLMDAKCPHYVAWQSQGTGDVRRIRVSDEESFYLALTTWLQDHALKQGEGLRDRYRDKYRGEYYLHDVSADAEGMVTIDDAEPFSILKMHEEIFLR